ncbi:MAG: S41 family peptidase [Ignavibacteriales bacterium]|nr:S41 family peptidase [Ignavibacteriales bacterium]
MTSTSILTHGMIPFATEQGSLLNLIMVITQAMIGKHRLVLIHGSKAYNGKMYLLIDASNASATFILARIAKANALATLIGEETGGNRRGINGSQLFFLRLPNSKIEIDIPLIGNYPLTPQPDEGIKPDIFVKQTAEDFISGRDTVLETVKKIILDN